MLRRLEVGAEKPIISVVLPVFNAEKYVDEAVRSILNQTFTNFELILINDGSTDGSLRILEQFRVMDKRVILVSRENRGLVESLNEGIDLARGIWIARMDADDIALSTRFERQLEWLKHTDADACGSWVQFFGTADRRILKHAQTNEAIKMEVLFSAPFAHPTVMMKTELVKKLRYDKIWEKCEDYDLWERATRAGWKMTNVPEVLLKYRQHEAQISTAASTKQQELFLNLRRRYWEFIFDSMELNKKWIDEVFKLRDFSPSIVNMDDVDSVFIALLQRNDGESRAVIFDHATRLYFRAASTCPDVAARWGKLNKNYGVGFAIGTQIKLLLLSVFRIHADSRLFELLKKLYFLLNSFDMRVGLTEIRNYFGRKRR